MEKNRRRFGLKMLVMPTIILLLVSFYPLFNSIYLSVTNTNILKKGQTVRFTGAANFIKLFSDRTMAVPGVFPGVCVYLCGRQLRAGTLSGRSAESED